MKKHGFTLIELMIVIVILGVLASTALPLYHAYIDSAAHSEASVNLVDIATKEEAYHAIHKEYIYTNDHKIEPIDNPYTKKPQKSNGANSSWVTLGYPDRTEDEGGIFGGPLYFRYMVNKVITGTTVKTIIYEVVAMRKLDDSNVEKMTLSQSNLGAITTTTEAYTTTP